MAPETFRNISTYANTDSKLNREQLDMHCSPLPISDSLPVMYLVPRLFHSSQSSQVVFWDTPKCISSPVAVLCSFPVMNMCAIVFVSPLCMRVNTLRWGSGDTWERRQRQKCLTCQSSAPHTAVTRKRRMKRNLKRFHPLNEEGLHLGLKSA